MHNVRISAKYSLGTLLVLGLAGIGTACGGSPTTPSTPPPLNLTGTWSMTTTAAGASGECADLVKIGGTLRHTVSIQQTGTSITGTLISDSDGSSCQFNGSLNGTQFVATTDISTCTVAAFIGAACSSGVRDLRIVSSSMSGTASASQISGTGAERHNIHRSMRDGFPPSSMTQTGSLSLQTSTVMQKR